MKEYLGDSVYANYDNSGNLILTTENDDPEPSNIIILEDDVFKNLLEYIKKSKE